MISNRISLLILNQAVSSIRELQHTPRSQIKQSLWRIDGNAFCVNINLSANLIGKWDHELQTFLSLHQQDVGTARSQQTLDPTYRLSIQPNNLRPDHLVLKKLAVLK